MRERVANNTLPVVRPIFEVVRNRFEAWRKRRLCRGRIPEDLWQAAVGLCQEHSICEVSQALRLNYYDLKSRVVKAESTDTEQQSGLGFVRLDLGSPIAPSECLVEMEAANGARMRMSFKGSLRAVDPVGLSRVFWRQGR